MARKPNPGLIDEDAPELTDEELAEMRPASEALPPDVFAMLTKRKPGQRGPGRRPAKVPVTIRVDPEALEAFRATGPGWQTRMSDVVREAATGRLMKPGTQAPRGVVRSSRRPDKKTA